MNLDGKSLVYLDNAATTHKPTRVLDAERGYYENSNANVHRGIYPLSERSTELYEEARSTVSRFINGMAGYTVFTSGTTDSLNLAARLVEQKLSKGDLILTTEVEHHSNFLPWLELAKRTGAELEILETDAEGKINLDLLKSDKKPKVLAITHCSNVTGKVTDLKKLVGNVRKLNKDILVVVDGAQAVPHIIVDMDALDVDFYAFSGHKMYAPMGIGVLWVKKSILGALRPVKFGGGMISNVDFDKWEPAEGVEQWEAGTPNVAGAVGLAEAVQFIEELSYETITTHEKELARSFYERVSRLKGVKLLTKPDIGLFSLHFDKYHPHDVSQVLAEQNVAVRAGHHCVQPYHKKRGINGSVRVSFGVYNESADVERFFEALEGLEKILG